MEDMDLEKMAEVEEFENNVETDEKVSDSEHLNRFIPKKDDFSFMKVLMNCIFFIIGVVISPVGSLKKGLDKFDNIKTSGFLLLFVALARMIINLFSNMISAVFISSKVSFSNLRYLKYINLIFGQLFGYIIIVLLISGIYYLISLIFKRKVNYFRLVSITTVSFISMFVIDLISTIASIFCVPLGLVLMVTSFIYSFLTFLYAVANEIKLTSDFNIYFQSICLVLIFILFYLLTFIKLINLFK